MENIKNIPLKEMVEQIQKLKKDYDEYVKNCYSFWPKFKCGKRIKSQ